MNPPQLRHLAKQWISLWCAPIDWQLFDRLHADDFEDCSPSGRATDKDGFAGGLRALLSAFPDLRTEIEDLVVDVAAAKVAVRWRATGTNRAEFLGVGPTHRGTSLTGIEIIEVAAGRVVRRWGEWDVSAFLDAAE
jgi:steroid delta-isomerase-like uncharacterized protein